VAEAKDIDLGFDAAHSSGSEFPPGLDPKNMILEDGSVIQWQIGSVYNSDGSFKGREILMKFDVTAEGKTDPDTLYHIDLDAKDGKLHIAGLTAAQKEGDWSSTYDPGQNLLTQWQASAKAPEFQPEVPPSHLLGALQFLVNRPEFKAAVDDHAAQAKLDAVAPSVEQQAPAAGQSNTRAAPRL
jgi:hypothetical protein